jgi:hypothetical protein
LENPGLIYLIKRAEIINNIIIKTALMSKNKFIELLPRFRKLINQFPVPIIVGYSNELVADWYGKIFVSRSRSE